MIRLAFCVACGNPTSEHLHHHHLVPRSCGGTDDPTNLITLCVACHGKVHGVEWDINHRERTKAGMQRTRLHGTKSGRPIGRAPLARKLRDQITKRTASGETAYRIAKETLALIDIPSRNMPLLRLLFL